MFLLYFCCQWITCLHYIVIDYANNQQGYHLPRVAQSANTVGYSHNLYNQQIITLITNMGQKQPTNIGLKGIHPLYYR